MTVTGNIKVWYVGVRVCVYVCVKNTGCERERQWDTKQTLFHKQVTSCS
jgi:hypothetical protein